MSAHTLHTRHDFPPVAYIAAVLNQALAVLVEWLSILVRAIVGPEFIAVREPFGADEEYVPELRELVRQQAADRRAVVFHALPDSWPGLAINDSTPLLATYDAAAFAMSGGAR